MNSATANFRVTEPGSPSRPLALLPLFSLAAALSALLGYLAHLPRLADWSGSGVVVYPNDAFAGLCLSVGTLLCALPGKPAPQLTRLLGALAALLGFATLLEHVPGIDLRIDQLIAPAFDPRASAPNRPGVLPCLAFLLLGPALIFNSTHGRFRRALPALAITAAAIALLPLLGHAFQAEPLFSDGTPMRTPVQTAIMILAVSLTLLASAPDLEPLNTLRQRTTTGMLARRALPVLVGLPALLGLLCRLGRDAGWLGARTGLPLMVFTLVALFSWLTWWWASALTAYDFDLRQQQDALRQSERQLATELEARKAAESALSRTLETAAAGLTRCSRDLRYISANPAYARLLGLPLDQIVGRPIVEVMGEAALEKIKPYVERVLRGERVQYENELPYAPSGPRFVHAIYAPETGPDGAIVGWVACIIDITDRKLAEQAVRESETWLRLAKEAANLGIYDVDVRSGQVRWDERMRELWELPPGSPVNRNLAYERIHPEDRALIQTTLSQALDPAGSGKLSLEYRLLRSDNQPPRWVSVTGQTQFEHGRPVRLVGAVQDITARKEFEAELERLVAERTAKHEELIGELEHFSYTITHDMRAPLRAMLGFADQALEMETTDKEAQQQLMQRIIRAAERMDLLIVDALRYNRAVRQQLTLAPVNVSMLLRDMLDSYPEFQVSNACILVQPDMPPVLGNQAGLTQCFSNLLNNALKFVGPGTAPHIRIWAEPVATTNTEAPPTLRIYVEDNGIGIPEAFQPRIFSMFSRGSAKHEGSGIGLALVRKVTERMGGRVGVESQVGKGSRFWLQLQAAPLAPTHAEPGSQTDLARVAGV